MVLVNTLSDHWWIENTRCTPAGHCCLFLNFDTYQWRIHDLGHQLQGEAIFSDENTCRNELGTVWSTSAVYKTARVLGKSY